MESGWETERSRKYKGDQTFNFVVFYCVAIDPMYKLSNYVKMATMVMFGDEKGEKLWAMVNSAELGFLYRVC